MLQKNILLEDLPGWYELGMSKDGKSIEIRIHKVAMESIKSILSEQSPIVTYLQENLQLPPFIDPTERAWGFGEILQETNEQREDWTAWECKLPQSEERQVNHNRGYAVSATLNVLFLALQCVEEETDSPIPQFMVITGFLSQTGLAGGSLSVHVSPAFLKRVSRLLDKERESVEQAMRSAYSCMFHIPGHNTALSSFNKFQVWWRDSKWLNLVCPGDACDLGHGDYNNPSLDVGYTLLPHNVDGPLQQLTLLAGLAKLWELAGQSRQ